MQPKNLQNSFQGRNTEGAKGELLATGGPILVKTRTGTIESLVVGEGAGARRKLQMKIQFLPASLEYASAVCPKPSNFCFHKSKSLCPTGRLPMDIHTDLNDKRMQLQNLSKMLKDF
jgi:hypothetical protein